MTILDWTTAVRGRGVYYKIQQLMMMMITIVKMICLFSKALSVSAMLSINKVTQPKTSILGITLRNLCNFFSYLSWQYWHGCEVEEWVWRGRVISVTKAFMLTAIVCALHRGHREDTCVKPEGMRRKCYHLRRQIFPNISSRRCFASHFSLQLFP